MAKLTIKQYSKTSGALLGVMEREFEDNKVLISKLGKLLDALTTEHVKIEYVIEVE